MDERDTRPPAYESTAEAELVDARDSDWQRIEIRRHPVYGHQLVIDGDLQISESDFAYGSALVAPVLTLASCRRVAILGGGDGGVLSELLVACDRLSRPLETVTLIDIDGAVIELCREWMPRLCHAAFDDPRAEVMVGDAFAWLANASALDAVIYDLTLDPVREGVSRNAFIREILDQVERALRPGGVVTMQACGEWVADREQLLAELRTRFDESFVAREEQLVTVPSYGEKWTFITARKPD
jgi:spermidine synthase/spermine synthase